MTHSDRKCKLEQKGIKMKEHICQECGTEKIYKSHSYKCPKCKKNKIYNGICPICSNEFVSSYPNQRFCSPKCNVQNTKLNKNNYQTEYAKLRWNILLRDKFQCQYCGRTPFIHGISLHVDHIKPRVKDGLNTEDNLITSCEDCNIGKGCVDKSKNIKEYFGEKEWRLKI